MILGERLKAPILDAFAELFDEFKAKGKLRSYLPATGAERICPICRRNQEATEFAYATIPGALDPFITESREFRELLAEKGYASG